MRRRAIRIIRSELTLRGRERENFESRVGLDLGAANRAIVEARIQVHMKTIQAELKRREGDEKYQQSIERYEKHQESLAREQARDKERWRKKAKRKPPISPEELEANKEVLRAQGYQV